MFENVDYEKRIIELEQIVRELLNDKERILQQLQQILSEKISKDELNKVSEYVIKQIEKSHIVRGR